MKNEKQICTEFQAQKLKELGVDQSVSICVYETHFTKTIALYRTGLSTNVKLLSAFTVYELMVMLPDNRWAVGYRYGQLDLKSDVFTESKIVITKYHSGYEIAIVSLEGKELFSIRGLDLAVACAEMLIYLLEHGLISVDVVNQQLQAA